MKLTLEQAKEFRHFLEQTCISYYNFDLRDAFKIVLKELNEQIQEEECADTEIEKEEDEVKQFVESFKETELELDEQDAIDDDLHDDIECD